MSEKELYKWYIYPSIEIQWDEVLDKKNLQEEIDSIISNETVDNEKRIDDILSNNIENKEINEKIDNIYDNSLKNYEFLLEEQFEWVNNEDLKEKSLLIQIPFSHSVWFITKLIEKINNSNSILSKIKVDYFILNTNTINNHKENPEKIEKLYWDYIKRIEKSDKFIEIKDTTVPYNQYTNTDDLSKNILTNEKKFMDSMFNLSNPRLKTYFPTKLQAEEAGLEYKEFVDIWNSAMTLDIKIIKEANKELIEKLEKYEYINIKWNNWTHITFWVKDKYWDNSYWKTNQPWAEVFTVPHRDQVNWTIIFEEKNIIKMFWKDDNRVIENLKLEFERWELIEISINKKWKLSEIEKEQLKKLKKIIFTKNLDNRFLWEIAFWTTPQIKAGSILHPLAAEKASGSHIALWKCYTREWKGKIMDNGNNNADFHWDLIWSMKKYTITWKKENWDIEIIMNKWNFSKNVAPKLDKYKNSIKRKK